MILTFCFDRDLVPQHLSFSNFQFLSCQSSSLPFLIIHCRVLEIVPLCSQTRSVFIQCGLWTCLQHFFSFNALRLSSLIVNCYCVCFVFVVVQLMETINLSSKVASSKNRLKMYLEDTSVSYVCVVFSLNPGLAAVHSFYTV